MSHTSYTNRSLESGRYLLRAKFGNPHYGREEMWLLRSELSAPWFNPSTGETATYEQMSQGWSYTDRLYTSTEAVSEFA